MTKDEFVPKLKSLVKRLEEIEDLLPPKPVSQGSLERAKQLLVSIRNEMESEYRRMDTIKGKATLNEDEENYYHPAIWKSYLALSLVKVNTRPSEIWRSHVYDSSGEIKYILSWMEQTPKE